MLLKEQMTNINKREKGAIDNRVDQIDLDGEKVFGEYGLVEDLTTRILNTPLEIIP